MNETPSNRTEEMCAALRHQLNSVLVLLLIVSATLTIFFLRQSTQARKERDILRQSVEEYNQNAVPALTEFTAKLREYAKSHSDVVPILVKYGVVQATNTAAATK